VTLERRRSVKLSTDQREQIALESLAAIGFEVTLHEPPHTIEADPLMGIQERHLTGTCVAVCRGRGGKRKVITGCSACQTLDEAVKFLRVQEERYASDIRFMPLAIGEEEELVIQRPAGDTATTALRHIVRRELSFDEHGAITGATETPA
jgi:hypothetical protein